MYRPCDNSSQGKIGTGKARLDIDKRRAASAGKPCSKALQQMPRKATLTGLWVDFGVGGKGVLDFALIVDTPHGLNHTIAQCSHLPGVAVMSFCEPCTVP